MGDRHLHNTVGLGLTGGLNGADFAGQFTSRMPGTSTGTSNSPHQPMLFVRLSHIDTPIGEMIAAASEEHLVLLEYVHRRTLDAQLGRVKRAVPGRYDEGRSPIIDRVRAQLDEYFRGERCEFEVPLLVPGTPFQERVWNELRRIPHGQTTSYGGVAKSIGQPNAVRAVARANGDNRIAIIIPCHRVIAADGSLTGYGGGLWRKKKLLELEARSHELSLFDPG